MLSKDFVGGYAYKLLRLYGTPSCCEILSIEINNKMNSDFIISYFPKPVTYSIAQWVRGFYTNL